MRRTSAEAENPRDSWAAGIQVAAAALAAMPGVATLVSGLSVPGELQIVFGASYTIVGTTMVMILWSSRESLLRRSVPALRRLSISCLMLGLLGFGVYQFLFRQTTFVLTDYRRAEPREIEYRFPLFGGGDVAAMIEERGSRAEAIVRYTPERMLDRLQEPDLALWLSVTDLILLSSFLLVAIPFSLGLGIAGIMTQKEQTALAGENQGS